MLSTLLSLSLSLASSKPLVLGLTPRLGLLLVSMILLFSFTLPPCGCSLILLYVYDMLITGDDFEYIAFVKARLSEKFHTSDLGPLSYFLMIEVASTSNGYYLS
jgi:hypothetical protein